MATNGLKRVTSGNGKENRLSVRIPVSLEQRIIRIARMNGISGADVVRMALNVGLPSLDGKGKAA